ncbi:MAG: type 2 isopentenyl-diphosphate Delta-isomerase, partial [Anaerolineaceae bacterium]
MEEVTPLGSRKADHIQINLDQDVQSGLTTGFEKYRFIHQAVPELDLAAVRTDQLLFGKSLRLPLLISSMTGGTTEAAEINRRLAEAAQQTGIALGVGSQRIAVEQPDRTSSFNIRRYAPNILLFANLGAVQLNYGYTSDQCLRAVEMIEADGLFLHLNAVQEAVQPEGNTNFSGLLAKIEQVCHRLTVPVIAKEVGWGISEQAARALANAGVAAIDIAGAGGTSWSQVEMYRAKNAAQTHIAATFQNWGIPTAESLCLVHQALPDMLLFASGGLKGASDLAKSIALGATLGG